MTKYLSNHGTFSVPYTFSTSFTMYIDILYIYKYITKYMYLENLKHLII